MSSFTNHLQFLTSESNDDRPGPRDSKFLRDEWIRQATGGSSGPSVDNNPLADEVNHPSVLDTFQELVASTIILGSLLSKHELRPLLPNILEALSSPKSDDAVSNELVDVIGFEHVDLAEKLMRERTSLTNELSRYLAQGHENGLDVSLSHADARRRIEDTLRQNATRPLYTGVAVSISYLRYSPT